MEAGAEARQRRVVGQRLARFVDRAIELPRTAAEGRSSNTPLRLTLLLDNSGSMERADRQQTVRRAFAMACSTWVTDPWGMG